MKTPYAILIAVVLGVLLSIFLVYEVRTSCTGCGDPYCASNTITEISTRIQKAQSGIVLKTDPICMYFGEILTADVVMSRTDNLDPINGVTFSCGENAAVCSGNSPVISVSGQTLTANRDARFNVIVSCEKPTGDKYRCELQIVNA